MLFDFPGNRFCSKLLNYLIQVLIIAGSFSFVIALLTGFIRRTTTSSRLIGALVGILVGVFFSIMYANIFDNIFRVSNEMVSTVLIFGIALNTIIVLYIYRILNRGGDDDEQ